MDFVILYIINNVLYISRINYKIYFDMVGIIFGL